MTELYTLSAVEHAFYKAGETSGFAKALEKAARDLRGAAQHYRRAACEEQTEQVDALVRPLEQIAEQLEGEGAKGRGEIARMVGEAVKTKAKDLSSVDRLRRAFQGAVLGARNGWRGLS